MVISCVAYGCNSLQHKGNNISFHSFPHKNPTLLKMWIGAVRRENWKPSMYSKLCSKHFKSTDYLEIPSYVKRLKPKTVPSLFNYPKHLHKQSPNMCSCAVRICYSRQGVDKKKSTGITFHRFPKNESRREAWTNFVNRRGWQATKSSVLCSRHFSEECFDRTSLCVVRLKPDAVPTLNKNMDCYRKRLSMNTSLKNARIFDDDSWDAEEAGLIVKKEPPTSDFYCDFAGDPYRSDNPPREEQHVFQSIKIKTEVKRELDDEFEDISRESMEFENSRDKCDLLESKVKRESNEENGLPDIVKTELKQEPFASEDELEESYLDNIDDRIKYKLLHTPNKAETRHDYTEDSNPSPFNKEMFRNFNLGQGYGNSEQESSKQDSRKSVKRSVFSRLSPYKKFTPEEEPPKKMSVMKRLGPPVSTPEIPRKKQKKVEMETDPQTLARRQKQIDFGKNTTGYDNYVNSVPRNERTREDPQTPDKFIKYSRRGWDGLIKQWRVKLHKYDPSDPADT